MIRALFSRVFGSSEISKLLSRLDHIDRSLSSPVLPAVRERVEYLIRAAPGEYVTRIRNGRNIDGMIYTMIANYAAIEAESGRHHIYRGALDERGSMFLRLHDTAIDHLVALNEITRDAGDSHKSGLRKRVEEAG